MARRAGQQEPAAFASVVASLLRQSRRRQGLTQAEVAQRTAGLVSKAALANYETGHRSLRVDVFWVIARALGEDPGALLAGAERSSGYGVDADAAPITVDVEAVLENSDARLAPVRRWFALRLQRGGARLSVRTVTLDHGAVSALAALMGISPAECRRLLQGVGTAVGEADPIPPAVATAG